MCKQLIIFLMVFTAAHLYAQQEEANSTPLQPKMELGIHGGPGFSIFYNEHPLQNPRNPQRPVYNGGMAGISFQYNFTKMVALHTELNYERKGDIYYSIAGWDNSYIYSEHYALDRIHYITLPVTARLSFGRNIKFFIDAGLYAAVAVRAQREISDMEYVPYLPVLEGTVSANSRSTDITSDVARPDGGVVTGIGVFLPAGKRVAFSFEWRNNVGFADANANTGLYQNRFYNNSTSAILGLSFALDRPYKFGFDRPVRQTEPQRY